MMTLTARTIYIHEYRENEQQKTQQDFIQEHSIYAKTTYTKTTNSQEDIIHKSHTCTKIGLRFFFFDLMTRG